MAIPIFISSTLTQIRKERDRQHREEDFLQAAEELFAEKGFHHSSIDEIAARAEYATGTIYRYFKSKEDLYVELLRRKLEVYLEMLSRRVAEQESAIKKLRSFVQTKFRFFHENRAFLSIYTSEFVKGGCAASSVPESCHLLHSKLHTLLADTIRLGVETNEFEKCNPDSIAAAISGMTTQVLMEALESPVKDDFTSLEGEIIRFLEQGLINHHSDGTSPSMKNQPIQTTL